MPTDASAGNGSGTIADLEDNPGLKLLALADQKRAATEADLAASKIRFAPGQLTIRDLKRARVVLGGRNPFDLLEDQLDAMTLTVWCVRSRTDPTYTWDQAEDASLDDFEQAKDDDEPPQEAAPTTSGSTRGEPSGTGTSGSARRKRTSAASTT